MRKVTVGLPEGSIKGPVVDVDGNEVEIVYDPEKFGAVTIPPDPGPCPARMPKSWGGVACSRRRGHAGLHETEKGFCWDYDRKKRRLFGGSRQALELAYGDLP